jgi:hypothetical protein
VKTLCFLHDAVARGAALLPLAVGCTEQIPLGLEPPEWKADHETGDLSQWSEDGNGGTYDSNGTLATVESPVHSGRYAAKSSIDTSGSLAVARLYRQDNLPEAARYSVWLYIPAQYTVGQYWSVFEFQGRTDATDSNSLTSVWSLNLRELSTSDLLFYVWDGLRSQELKPVDPVVAPVGRWFRVEAFLEQATDDTGRVTFWIDGALFIDQSEVSTVPTKWLSWAVGSVAPRMTPETADLYVDDAMIWRTGSEK